jgi:type I restriction enzyme R subunit
MRVLNVLKSFADFDFNKLEMTEYEFDGYKSKYLDIWKETRPQGGEGKQVFWMMLILSWN